jgi:hypothetical protein
VLDRFGQIEPKILFCADGYRYAGREHDSLARVAEIAGAAPYAAQGRGRAAPSSEARYRRHSEGRVARGVAEAPSGRHDSLRATAVRSPALHPLHVWDHRETQMHRAQRRRRAAERPEDVQAAVRRAARRSLLLLHHHELGGVESPVRRPRCRGERDALRRLAVRARRRHPLRLRGQGAIHALRHLSESTSMRSRSAPSCRRSRTTSRRCG